MRQLGTGIRGLYDLVANKNEDMKLVSDLRDLHISIDSAMTIAYDTLDLPERSYVFDQMQGIAQFVPDAEWRDRALSWLLEENQRRAALPGDHSGSVEDDVIEELVGE